MGLAENVAKARLAYHANMVDLVNVGNQLGLIKDEKAEDMNRKHVMTLIEDVLPRIYGQAAVDKLLEE